MSSNVSLYRQITSRIVHPGGFLDLGHPEWQPSVLATKPSTYNSRIRLAQILLSLIVFLIDYDKNNFDIFGIPFIN